MKLSLALIAATATANKGERKQLREERQMRAQKRKLFTPLRYVYQFPVCDSVEQCVNEDNPKCDGQTFTNESGSISHRGYEDYFNCRWEIKAQDGNHVGLKFFDDFDLEWQSACGFDRVHIRCLDDPAFDSKGGKPISRLCGPKNREGNSSIAYDALKIMPKKSFFKESTSTQCKHVLIEFNTDQDTQGMSDYTGFTLGYYQEPCEDCISDPCKGKTIFEISQCLVESAINASVAEYNKQIANAAGNTKLLKKLTKNKAVRLENAERHVVNYMTKMMGAISRCGRGFSAEFSNSFFKQMKEASVSNSAEEMFAVWNLFATNTMTGEGAHCKWYDADAGAEGIEESSFPCRTRRLFLKMLGLTQYGQYTECNAANFDINQNTLF